MADKLDLTPEKVRIKDSYRERIFAESQQLDKSYLETLYFIIDCYFAFRKGAFPTQQVAFTPINTEDNKLSSRTATPFAEEEEDSDGETFSLDFDL
ncbi:hypothetical protein [Nostoc sp. 'Peltigera membranacea cyanobiont' N6]|uniref:hypothetical protein n=1 Tax=Nostoc sp. 'Peltigera membranacea cyanobiont' N6 TaxID=1261031 RepID=UPI000CF332A3|nr:hypothetical protein [Nostoc sp. 'Peltigera membranacea cyanobiont' N6]AVH63979.1 hypothetical protein NPM_2255 [Nostoc sp. 'Peltigera membranacea cyanobiont' N6]